MEAIAFLIPRSKRYPRGIKYSFQHYDPDSGETILRYDNYSEHSKSRHHKHLRENETVGVKFKSLHTHFKKFMKEVKSNEK